MPVKAPIDTNSRSSASATDADNHLKGADAAQAEDDRIEQWTKPTFAGGGRQQSSLDGSFGFRERRR